MYPSGVCPSPARETAPGFSLRGREEPQITDFDRQRLRVEALEKPLRRERRSHLIWWDEEEESDVGLRVERMIAQGKAHPDDRLLLRFVEAVNYACCRPCYVPVRGAAGFAFCQPVQIDDEGSL